MKKTITALILSIIFSASPAIGQQDRDFTGIDIMLIHGEYEKVVDTCLSILKADSLSAEAWYRLGLGYQNLPPDEKSFECFLKADEIDTVNNLYRFMVGKGYFEKNRNTRARAIFKELCTADSMNWSYAYYLTSIYMREGLYDEAIKIYKRFYETDSTNCIILNRLGFAYLRKREFSTAIDYYEKSFAKNRENLTAIRNLSYLYPFVNKTNIALQLLSEGLKIDPLDTDLYARRATIYFSRDQAKLYLADYLKILAYGDSTVLYLKRAGIGYFKSSNPTEAVVFLEKAYEKDSTDYELLDYLAKSYHQLKNFRLSQYYYLKKIELLDPLSNELGITYSNLGYEYVAGKMYNEAIDCFLRSNKIIKNPGLIMVIANLYDERLNNISRAIYYYRDYLSDYKNSGWPVTPDYIESVKKRIEYLEKIQKESARGTTVK